MYRVFQSRSKPDQLPIENEIDVFGEALNQAVDLRKRRAAFKDEGFSDGDFENRSFRTIQTQKSFSMMTASKPVSCVVR